MHTPDPTPAAPEAITPDNETAEAGATAARGVARRDRLGVRVAWGVILLCVAVIVAVVSRGYAARDGARQGATGAVADDSAAGAANPQLRLLSKYAVAAHRLTPGSGPQYAAQLREAAKTPADRVAIIPPIAELLGRDAALRELDGLPRTVPPGLAGRLNGPAPAGRDADALRATYAGAPGATQSSAADHGRLRDRLGWSGRLAATFGRNDADPERRTVLDEATTVFALVLGLGLAAVGGLIVGFGLLVLAVVLLSQRRLRLRYGEPLAVARSHAPVAEVAAGDAVAGHAAAGETGSPAGGPADRPASPSAWPAGAWPPGTLPPAWSGLQLPKAGPPGRPSLGRPPWPPGYPLSPPGYLPPPQAGFVPAYTSLPPAPAYALGPLRAANGRTGPFLEAFAIYIAGQILVSLAARLLLPELTLSANFVVLLPVLLAVVWPRIRGVRGDEYRRGFGFVAPSGVLRELSSGVVGYVAGLPVAAVGMLVTILLVRFTGASPSHPIVQEAVGAGRWQTVLLFALAVVWAPVVEEMFFRGALFHHLRTRWGWLMSALLSSLIFAAVHPQGWSLIPGLAGLAVVFSAIREWRSSTYAGMAAHALHNGTIVTLLVVGVG